MNACDNSAKTMVCAECAVTKDVPVKDYYTMAEVTRLLHVSKEKIRRWDLHVGKGVFPVLDIPEVAARYIRLESQVLLRETSLLS